MLLVINILNMKVTMIRTSFYLLKNILIRLDHISHPRSSHLRCSYPRSSHRRSSNLRSSDLRNSHLRSSHARTSHLRSSYPKSSYLKSMPSEKQSKCGAKNKQIFKKKIFCLEYKNGKSIIDCIKTNCKS